MNRYDLVDDDEEGGMLATLAGLARNVVARNPALVGWGLAASVVGAYASLNALAFQDQRHPSAFFQTRMAEPNPGGQLAQGGQMPIPGTPERPVTRIVFSNANDQAQPLPSAATDDVASQIEAAAAPQPVPVRAELQELLTRLGHYDGKIDGLDGPRTRAAIESYKTAVGLAGIELPMTDLLTSLRNNALVTAAIPRTRPVETTTQVPVPAPVISGAPEPVRFAPPTAAAPVVEADPMVMKVQAGLRAFGNLDIVVDGRSGSQTSAAIREFQSLFRLETTGEITPALIEKMIAVGLID